MTSIIQTLNEIEEDGKQLEKHVANFLNLLKKRGLAPNVDFVGQIRNGNRQLASARGQAHDLVVHHALLQKLIASSAEMTSSLELQEVLDKTVNTVVALTSAGRAYLMLHNENTGDLEIRSRYNWTVDEIPADEATYSRSVVEAALNEGRPIITTNAMEDDRFSSKTSVAEMNLLSILCIPLFSQGRPLGVLYADSDITAGMFSDSLVPLLSSFSLLATMAIENAGKFEHLEEELRLARQEVQKLKIQIDPDAIEEETRNITEAPFFEKLLGMADDLRKEFGEG